MVYSNYVSNVIKSGLTGYTTPINIIYKEVTELNLVRFLLMKFLTFISFVYFVEESNTYL